MKLVTITPKKTVTKINKESLTTKLTLVIIGLTAGSALLVPATYASFHPVTTGEIADNTIRSADISNTAGVQSVDIVNGQVGSVDIGTGQVASVDIANDAIRPNIQIKQGSQATMTPGNDGTSDANCPTGTVVSGGGFFANDRSINVYWNYPFDADTWTASGNNGHPTDTATLWAYAVCIGPMP